MKHKVELIIFLLLGLTLVYVFPFAFVDAAKLQSGVTINAPSTTQTETICNDTIDNDNDGKIDAADENCATANNSPTAEPCGLNIKSGVPINYGQVNPGQEGPTSYVVIENLAHVSAKVMVKGGDWISDVAGNTPMSGPEITHVSTAPNLFWAQKPELRSYPFVLTNIPAGTGIVVWFQVKVPANAVSGSFHQEVTIDLVCNTF